jgi:nickel-dependent lactate racemase
MELRYGDKIIDLELPDGSGDSLIRSHPSIPDMTPEEIISTALDRCDEYLARIKPGKQVVIVTSDITRYTGSEIYLPLLVDRLHTIGVSESDITIVIALGIHRKQTETEHRKILGSLSGRVRVVDHDCDDPGKLVMLGVTGNGIEVEINRTVAEADHVILTGTIGFHYFAGFGGGRKSVLPGVASRKSCMASHFAVLNPGEGSGRNPRATTGVLNNNPVNQAMDEACAMLEPLFILNTVLAPDKSLLAAFAGDWREAHAAGCSYYAKEFSFAIGAKSDLVVVSCGGFPKDINLIQAHKSMEYAAQALKDGGVMILLAECRDGYGNATFFDWFRFAGLDDFEAALRKHYEINGQTAYSLLQKALRFRIILVSRLPHEEVRTMGLTPADDLYQALALAEELLPEEYSAYIIPEGGTVFPVMKNAHFSTNSA